MILNKTKRNTVLDLLKGIAIIAVILYHLGVSEFGYLGVDVFLVISGYLVSIGLIRNFNDSKFSYWEYFNKRIVRLWPGLVLISIASLIFGWYFMLPLHFKLDCEAAIGTCLFSNNFVQYITSGNYWMADNEYKPLMHTWYIGVLVQFYLIIPLVFLVSVKFFKKWIYASFYILAGLCFISLLLYLSPLLSVAQGFYLLPARFFELGVGGLIAISGSNGIKQFENKRSFFFYSLFAFALILLFGLDIESYKLRLVVVVGLTIIMVCVSEIMSINDKTARLLTPICFLGVASYSLYLIHQVFFALYKYALNDKITIIEHLFILLLTVLLGVGLYYGFEKPLSGYISKRHANMYKVNFICLLSVIGIIGFAGYYYKHNGLVRDIPELDLFQNQECMTPEDYNSTIFSFDNDFPQNGKQNILVIGDSFGRDWCNVLIEAGVDSVMNISYRTAPDEVTIRRIEQADFVFVANNGSVFQMYSKIIPRLMQKKFYRVGMKGFGSWSGLVYSKRNSDDYFRQTVDFPDVVKHTDLSEKEFFPNHYIDMMSPIKVDDSTINIFTEDNKLISQDCLHLTKAGAQMYAEKLDVWQYLK